MTQFIEPEGERTSADRLSVSRARALADALAEGSNDFALLIDCFSTADAETVVFEVDVEVGQIRKHPIEHRERLAAVFDRDDWDTPELLALRQDFPSVPHLNLRLEEFPRSLCLYDELFRDLKKTWTAPRFVERAREWLALTAKGVLHQDDQPLEPLFVAAHHVVLPDDLFDNEADLSKRLNIESVKQPNGRLVCLLSKAREEPNRKPKSVQGSKAAEPPPEFVATAFQCVPQSHGVIRSKPTTLHDLHEILEATGTDLLGDLRTRVKAWDVDDATLSARVILVISFPKTRGEKGTVEATDVWTFLTATTLKDLGKAIGLWDLQGEKRAHLVWTDESQRGKSVELELLHSHFELSRWRAATLNGIENRFEKKIVGVGAGAIGSQVVLNLVRSAFGEWTIIDDDVLFPHNLSRHAVEGAAVGYPKAYSLACFANSVIEGEPIARSISVDILDSEKEKERIEVCLKEAALVIDMSASVTVARHLAIEAESPGRRVSLFMNPTGDDLVLLAEDAERSIQLDSVEMQYYRALANDDRLEGHFKPRDSRRRYGQSCRDVTSEIPQDLVALHAATASRALKAIASTPAARISVWRADSDGNVRRVEIGAAKTIRYPLAGWTVCTDAFLVHRLAEIREAKLPRETGGVLMGSFDLERRIVYIVDTIPSPPDSEEWPTLFIRGCRGLRAQVDEIADRTDGMLEYIGEWHSHPMGCSTSPSNDDLQVFSWLTELMNVEGIPALMMIVGDGGHSSCYLGQMSSQDSLEIEVKR